MPILILNYQKRKAHILLNLNIHLWLVSGVKKYSAEVMITD